MEFSMPIGSSREIEPAIERHGKQQRKRQPRADLLISGHIFRASTSIIVQQFQRKCKGFAESRRLWLSS
jgi:hypothetical protein